MMSFLLQFTLASSLFYVVYMSILSRDTFFQWRRIYLIGSLFLSLVIPFITHLSFFQSEYLSYHFVLPEVVIGAKDSIGSGEIVQSQTSIHPLLWVYMIGVMFFLIKSLIALSDINRMVRKGTRKFLYNYTLIDIKGLASPCSFYNYIFIDTSMFETDELERILLHEEAHVIQKHSVDIMMIEVLGIIFWFHPIIYLFRTQIKINHEYQADQKVIERYSRQQYGHILLKQTLSGKVISAANYFYNPFIKKRIMMMYNKRTHNINRLKYLLVLPFALGLVLTISNCTNEENSVKTMNDAQEVINEIEGDQTSENVEKTWEEVATNIKNENTIKQTKIVESAPPPPPPPPPPHEYKNSDVFKVVENMPRFKGCEEISGKEERSKCAQGKMLQFIYNNLTYPAQAKENGTQGTVVIQFVVRKNGKINDINVVREVKDGCSQASKKVIEMMNDDGGMWIPGSQQGKLVDVLFTLPVKFKLEED